MANRVLGFLGGLDNIISDVGFWGFVLESLQGYTWLARDSGRFNYLDQI